MHRERPGRARHEAALPAKVGAALALLLAAAACRPVGLAGDACTEAPCADGLTCKAGVCTLVTPPPPPPPPCTQDSDCVLDGSADGRVCNTDDGSCGFASCAIDAQCGTRICDNGQCAQNVPCFADGDCASDQICNNGSCRAACTSDADCPAVGGFNLATCVDGQCLQRCLNDTTCILGGICEQNTCVDPQCSVDEDCTGPGNHFCNAGRCEQFTPCAVNADCFDANFQCNDLGRCEERPACTVDGDCGLGLCVTQHCRDPVPCDTGADCADGDECVAGRCVAAPACRTAADCDAGEVCNGGRCAAAPESEDAAVVVVRTPLGACFAQGAGACAVPALVGAVVPLYAQGFGDDGAPVLAALSATPDGAGLSASVDDQGRGSVTCDAAGTATVAVVGGSANAAHVDVTVRCLTSGGALDVVAYDAATGAALEGAHVFLDDAEVGVTGAGGLFSDASFTGGAVGVRTDDGRGFVLVDAAPGALFVPLAAAVSQDGAAGFRALVNGTGDELGDIGLALALPELSSPLDASLENVMGGPFPGAVTVAVIGALPITLPASSIMDATLPLSGFQDVKPEAFDVAAAGPSTALAYEGRFAQQFLLNVAFGGTATSTALDFAAQAEGMDIKLAAAGVLEALPLVVDDGDIDGDGNTTELVPDYQSFPEISVAPETGPSERVGVKTSAPPQGADARALAVCGVELPNGFLPLGIAALVGSDAGEQVKVVGAPAGVPGAPRTCTVHAVTGDPATTSAVVARAGAGFAPLVDAGPLLAPPAGAFVLDGVPVAGAQSVVVPGVPGADALSVLVFDGGTTWTVLAPAAGSVPLPAYVDPVVVAGTTAYRLGAPPPSVLSAALGSVDDVAAAVATSP